MKYLKPLFFTAIFALTLNAATAQKKSPKIEKAQQAQSLNARENVTKDAENEKWVYMIVLVTDTGDKLDMKFLEGKNEEQRKMMDRMGERQKKAMEASREMQTEMDLINFLSAMNYELISVVPDAASSGKSLKYYLRTKVKQ